MGVALAPGWVEGGKIVDLPGPLNLGSCLVFERNGPSVAIPDVRFGGNIYGPTQQTGS